MVKLTVNVICLTSFVQMSPQDRNLLQRVKLGSYRHPLHSDSAHFFSLKKKNNEFLYLEPPNLQVKQIITLGNKLTPFGRIQSIEIKHTD